MTLLKRIALLEQSKKPKTRAKHVGIEIECLYTGKEQTVHSFFGRSSSSDSRAKDDNILNSIAEYVIKLNIDKYIQMKYDGSISPDVPIDYPIEFALCIPERQLKFVLKRFKLVVSKFKLKVNSSCGLHVHIDMRTRRRDIVFNNLILSQSILYQMQPASRRNNSFCERRHVTSLEHELSWGSRYTGVNAQSLREHNTIELRMAAATVSIPKVEKWTRLLVAIANKKSYLSSPVADIYELGLPKPLETYVKKEIKEHR